MFSIEAKTIFGQEVRPAPFGIEGESKPRLIWEDPNPQAMIPFCQVIVNGYLLTADSIVGLKKVAKEVGLLCSDNAYCP